LIASAESQRQTGTPLICSHIPRVTASRASSAEDQRASGAARKLGARQLDPRAN